MAFGRAYVAMALAEAAAERFRRRRYRRRRQAEKVAGEVLNSSMPKRWLQRSIGLAKQSTKDMAKLCASIKLWPDRHPDQYAAIFATIR